MIKLFTLKKHIPTYFGPLKIIIIEPGTMRQSLEQPTTIKCKKLSSREPTTPTRFTLSSITWQIFLSTKAPSTSTRSMMVFLILSCCLKKRTFFLTMWMSSRAMLWLNFLFTSRFSLILRESSLRLKKRNNYRQMMNMRLQKQRPQKQKLLKRRNLKWAWLRFSIKYVMLLSRHSMRITVFIKKLT